MDKNHMLGLIGHAAIGHDYYDGQTISTRLWLSELRACNDFERVLLVDTYAYKKRWLSILFNFFLCCIKCKNIVIMLSGNGLSVILPLTYFIKRAFGVKFYNRSIGGNLDDFVKRHPKSIKYLNSLEVNWVQSKILVERLRILGIDNGEYLENFRNITPIDPSVLKGKGDKPYRFCTFCRVSESKGIKTAIEAIVSINRELGRGTAVLHIYGPIEDSFRETFLSLTCNNKSCIEYKGCIKNDEAVSVLSEYYLHLFPSVWKGEGFPGTFIDCYNAGLPTIASDWSYNSEYIEHGVTGYIYKWEVPSQMCDLIKHAISLPEDDYIRMRLNNLKEANKYRPEVVMDKIVKRILINCH